jgi:hypothetical protein
MQGECPPLEWARTYGASGAGDLFAEERALAIATAGSSLIFTGNYEGAIDLGGGPLTRFGDNRSLFVLSVDGDGVHEYSRGFGDPSSGLLFAPQATGVDVAARPDGGSVVVGSFAGAVDFGTQRLISAQGSVQFDAGTGCLLDCSPDALVLALDGASDPDWAFGFGDIEGDAASSVAVDAAGRIFVGGSFRGTLDLGGGRTAASHGGSDAFVLALDTSGSPLWLAAFGGSGDDAVLAIALGSDGAVLAGGTLTDGADLGDGPVVVSGDNDAFLVELDAAGAPTRNRTLGAQRAAVTGIATTGSTIVAVGAARGVPTLAGETFTTQANDAFVITLDPSLDDVWARVFGTRQNDGASSVALAPDGTIWVTGSLGFGIVDLGGGPLATNLSDGAFLLELTPTGEHVCSRRHLAEALGETIADGVTLGASLDALDVAVNETGAVVWAGALTGETTIDGVRVASTGSSDVFTAVFAAKP